MILYGGQDTRAGQFNEGLRQFGVAVGDTPVSEVVFDNLNGDIDVIYGFLFTWKNPLAQAVSLNIIFNDTEFNQFSGGMVKEQFNASSGTREDTFWAGIMNVADLQGGIPGTTIYGCGYFNANQDFPVKIYEGDSWAVDSTGAGFGDAQRKATRLGGFVVPGNITKMTIRCSDGVAAIGGGSDFRLFRKV